MLHLSLLSIRHLSSSPKKRERKRGSFLVKTSVLGSKRNHTDKPSAIDVIFGKFFERKKYVYTYTYRKERTTKSERLYPRDEGYERELLEERMSGGEGLRLWHVTGRRGAKRRTRRRPPPGASPAAPCLSLPAFASLFPFYPVLSYPPLPFIFLFSSSTPRPSTLARSLHHLQPPRSHSTKPLLSSFSLPFKLIPADFPPNILLSSSSFSSNRVERIDSFSNRFSRLRPWRERSRLREYRQWSTRTWIAASLDGREGKRAERIATMGERDYRARKHAALAQGGRCGDPSGGARERNERRKRKREAR